MSNETDIVDTKDKISRKDKKKSPPKSVIKAFFMPSAEYLGDATKEIIKSVIEPHLEQIRAKNIKVHVKAVEEKIEAEASTGKISIDLDREVGSSEQLRDFNNWVEGVQDIDPNNSTLSELWQGILIDIINGKSDNSLLINTLKQLELEEAAFLLKFRKNTLLRKERNTAMDYMIEKLKRLGLIELNIGIAMADALKLVLFSIILYILFTIIPALDLDVKFYPGSLINIILIMLLVALPLIRVVYEIHTPTYQLTWLSKRLLSSVSNEDASRIK